MISQSVGSSEGERGKKNKHQSHQELMWWSLYYATLTFRVKASWRRNTERDEEKERRLERDKEREMKREGETIQ